ncbi:NAD(P)H-binding protein [Staphylococcus sp. NRL 16/872]|uniref:NAD(P)H-binding protein n=1 Tax=Staphylococcus sp. NRL 16/872 TaxID=2930131 RepID=UPI001FB469F8|nr:MULTISPECIES: NAD(P)H-binding protein [unclassified Staphylococcus]MCJ1656982.1 NAD(P)H-binding protein [Staphylococcus sp. NRL 21/187]MCJ1662729.1 NAD(P)H-binding protein [Staphylococcus sp. NRL 18/288]MCJ1668837.1 NAD(P)H-binding protein [Staphylococcus sp. NRL 19/737]WEN69054.1 NAD(P)H-binding protein [Staphylococcus sp. NRL 16/872]
MKPNVLLAGGSGYIGKYISSAIENDVNLYALSKYPNTKKEHNDRLQWLQRDIYNYEDVVAAMEGMDIAVYYLDPTKNSAKLTQATARDLNIIAADNFARAAAKQGVNKIVYVSGSRFDSETVQRLENYGVPVETTNTQIKRPHINVELQVSKYDDVRTALRIILPKKWTLSHIVDYFFTWLNETRGTFVHTYKKDDNYIIYSRNKAKPMLILKKMENEAGLITLHLVGGSMVKPNFKKQGKLEFRQIKSTRLVMVHLYDYIPRLFWPVYYFIQAPIQGLIMRGFEIDCRIRHFNGRVQSGEKMKYTK